MEADTGLARCASVVLKMRPKAVCGRPSNVHSSRLDSWPGRSSIHHVATMDFSHVTLLRLHIVLHSNP
ncbi:hypothetical protein L915_21706 [Phytophthora nicotianae]|uniref:Uncharacterized protein n=1 Tax=Phytophthora nicotianae TaxID=4792 RepID=W2FLR5_PHYNI|nr:hypothetical protein L915_21706 [Phytophthora nicotianae]